MQLPRCLAVIMEQKYALLSELAELPDGGRDPDPRGLLGASRQHSSTRSSQEQRKLCALVDFAQFIYRRL